MKSILNFATGCRNNKTLNLSIVGFGDGESVYQLLKNIKMQLSEWGALRPFVFYNADTLSRAEGKPELLQKKVPLTSLRICKKDFDREYVGFVDKFKDDELYDYLFSSGYDDTTFRNMISDSAPYYSANNLSTIVHERFGQPDYDAEANFADVLLEIKQEVLPSGKVFARVNCKIGAYLCEENFEDYTSVFCGVIKGLDVQFSDVLHSAYISLNYPSMPIVRERVYRYYDPETLERYILGAEWYVYINKRVPIELDMLEKVSKHSIVEKVHNGITITANTDIVDFTGELRRKISNSLESLLIPACWEYDWSSLHNQLWNVWDLPRRVDVFSDAHNMRDPIIVLSHNHDIAHFCEMKMISLKNRIASYVLK